jgi:carbamoyltransferase
MTNGRFDALFGGPPRGPDERLDQRHMDLAASIQAVVEEVVLRLGRSIARDTGQKNLCLAGGVALNCVANGKLLKAGIFDDIWIQPAAGDAGGALGAALAAYHWHLGQARRPAETLDAQTLDAMSGAYLGPAYDDEEIRRRLAEAGARLELLEEDALLERTAAALAAGQAVGWFQGRMEFGPRALGNRSILGDARSPAMQKTLNLKVKYRESFRPFAPSCLAEQVGGWFELDRASPYMLLVADVKESRRRAMSAQEQALFGIDKLNVVRSQVPAVTHVDYSARIQSVHRETNPKYHALISRFQAATGCPLIVNTSFNVRGEPIVATARSWTPWPSATATWRRPPKTPPSSRTTRTPSSWIDR